MNLELAIRTTEILLAIAFIQQSIEHLSASKDERILSVLRIALSVLLLAGIARQWICAALLANGILILRRFQGPYNGGADRMSLLILSCLSLVNFIESRQIQEFIWGYLALQLICSYFVSGCFKVINPEWRSGQALEDIFRFSAFPATEAIRKLADIPRTQLCIVSWLVILFELLFPLTLLSQTTLIVGIAIALSFHLINTVLFGFNRFVWVWLAAYPSLLWLQPRIVAEGSYLGLF